MIGKNWFSFMKPVENLERRNDMKVKRMIEALQKMNPEDEVKLHHFMGNNALFVLKAVNVPGAENVVFIEDKDDNDMRVELSAQFEHAAEVGMDELNFFMDLLEIGIILEDIEKFLP